MRQSPLVIPAKAGIEPIRQIFPGLRNYEWWQCAVGCPSHDLRHMIVHNVWGGTPDLKEHPPLAYDYSRKQLLEVADIEAAVSGCAELLQATHSVVYWLAKLIERGVYTERDVGSPGVSMRTDMPPASSASPARPSMSCAARPAARVSPQPGTRRARARERRFEARAASLFQRGLHGEWVPRHYDGRIVGWTHKVTSVGLMRTLNRLDKMTARLSPGAGTIDCDRLLDSIAPKGDSPSAISPVEHHHCHVPRPAPIAFPGASRDPDAH